MLEAGTERRVRVVRAGILSARTENALRCIGILTAGDLKWADLGALWEVRNGAEADAELVELLYLSGPSQ